MNLKTLSDKSLHENTVVLAKTERELLSKVLWHLLEIYRRRLFSKFKCQSLVDYAVRMLGYSEDEAGRRVSAMRVFQEVSFVEASLNLGELTLTHLLIAKSVFRAEAKAGRTPDKEKILKAMCSTSTREAKKIARSFTPEPLNFEEIKVKAPEGTSDKFKKVLGLLSHKYPGLTQGELLNLLLDEKLEQLNKTPAAPRKDSQATITREVRSKACEQCNSTFMVERDHRHPKALGGDNSKANARSLCRSCNQRAAIEAYGQSKMDPYINQTG